MLRNLKKILRLVFLWAVVVGVIAAVQEQREQWIRKKQRLNEIHDFHGIYEKYAKRPLDAALATIAVIVLSPVMIITALGVYINLGTPILFRQERPGLNEKIFRLYKFRSMSNEKDKEGNFLPDEARLTKFGKVLRSTSLDELPELFNIIKGDMSLVGPRPLLVSYLDRYTQEQHKRHNVRPGLTGLATSLVRNGAGWNRKFELDLEYVDNISFFLDIKIMIWTIKIVLKREGINEAGEATNSEFMGLLKE